MREAVVALGVIWKFTPVSTWCAKPQVAVGATVGMVVYKYLSAWVKSLQEGKDVPQRRSLLSIEGSETDSLDLLSFDIEPHLAQLERRADRSAMIAVAQTILKNMGQRFGQGGWEACKDSNRGYMKCLNNNVFVTCDYGAWIPRKCGDGTRCQKSNENWVTCGW
ncbi:hypothetical protein BC832DRAFT_397475 [Gaertneriomyces semiglobifer]|nr:hypothetical protein BC832DRAFT_397475 [Gaertneriomyces semiglobifer]